MELYSKVVLTPVKTILVLLGLDLKLTYSQKPMPPSISATQRL